MVPPLRTSQKPSTRRRMKPGASSRTPETVLLLLEQQEFTLVNPNNLESTSSKICLSDLTTTTTMNLKGLGHLSKLCSVENRQEASLG